MKAALSLVICALLFTACKRDPDYPDTTNPPGVATRIPVPNWRDDVLYGVSRIIDPATGQPTRIDSFEAFIGSGGLSKIRYGLIAYDIWIDTANMPGFNRNSGIYAAFIGTSIKGEPIESVSVTSSLAVTAAGDSTRQTQTLRASNSKLFNAQVVNGYYRGR